VSRKEHAVDSGAGYRYEGRTLADTQFEVIDKSATRICRLCHATRAENPLVHEQTVEEDVNAAFRHGNRA
jgi:hypothetical protein